MSIGDKFDRWTVVAEPESIGGRLYVHCRCDCGKEKMVYKNSLKKMKSRSCGCLAAESCSKIGKMNDKGRLWNNHLYNIFMHIKRRCNNEKCHAYHRYGGRGIKCLFIDVNDFIEWAEKSGYRKGLQVDRINNDGDYSRENCRLVTAEENCNNTSRNVRITHGGVTKTFAQWCKHLGINYSTANSRRRRLGSHLAALGLSDD